MITVLRTSAVAFALAFASASVASDAPSLAKGNAHDGEAKAIACAACHGQGGNSTNPQWPNLAGQHAAYIEQSLAAYKSGDRVDPLMSGQASILSEEDMANLAAYFAAQPHKAGVASEESVAIAEPLFANSENHSDIGFVTVALDESTLLEQWQDPGITADTLAFLQYTSGSTGNPKGVMVSHHNLLVNEQMIAEAFASVEDEVSVSWLPLFHDMGLIGTTLQPLYIGGTAVFMSPASFLQRPLRWLRAISDYRGTAICAPNFAFDLCARQITEEQKAGLDLSSVRMAVSGAESVRNDTLNNFSQAFRDCGFNASSFTPTYGLAEATLLVSCARASNKPLVHKTWDNQAAV